MAEITAAMVKELREKTGAGMMDCKAALNETKGDMEAAVDWLRKKGLAKAAKKAGRVAAEGLIGISRRRHQGRRGRGQCGNRFRRAQRSFPGPGEADRRCRAVGRRRCREDQGGEGRQHDRRRSDRVVDRDHRREHVAAPRRRIVGRARAPSAAMCTIRSRTVSARSACWSRWNPPASRPNSPRSAAWLRCMSPPPIRRRSMPPVSIRRSIAREKDVLADKYKQQGKPANVIDKIVESGIKTFYKEVCLLEQAYIHEPDKIGRAGAEGSRRQGRRADQGHGLRALRARRRHREAGIGFRSRGRGRRQILIGLIVSLTFARRFSEVIVHEQAGPPSRHRQIVRRSAGRQPGLGHRSGHHRTRRGRSRRRAGARRRDRRRGRRRQYLSRRGSLRARRVARRPAT